MTAMTSQELGITSPAERAAAAQRRDATKRVRFVRDKLTSTSGTPAFDYQLLRQFAQNRLSASIAIVLLVANLIIMMTYNRILERRYSKTLG